MQVPRDRNCLLRPEEGKQIFGNDLGGCCLPSSSTSSPSFSSANFSSSSVTPLEQSNAMLSLVEGVVFRVFRWLFFQRTPVCALLFPFASYCSLNHVV